MIELNEAIRQRHSVRRYTGQSIEPEKVAILQEAIGKYNAESGLNIQLVLEEPKAFSSFLVTYGAFSGVKNYFVMAAPRGKEWEEKVGYYGEKLVLLSQALGLNTCWVGLTYKKIPDAYHLREGDIIHCEISLGYGANQGVQHPLRTMEKFYEADGEVPDWVKAGLEAALLAPTAVNQQKFKFILRDGNRVEAQALRSMVGYAIIDLGIVKCHFELGAGAENFAWK